MLKLAQVFRNNLLESEHYGIVVKAKKGGEISVYGDNNFACFTRSLIKPIQAKVAKDILGKDLAGELLAIAMSSHNAEPEQLALVSKLMNKFQINEVDLQCGQYQSHNHRLKSKLENNCSGKHSALLAACKKQGWSCHNYMEANHPIQNLIHCELKSLLGLRPVAKQSFAETGRLKKIATATKLRVAPLDNSLSCDKSISNDFDFAIDGCGLPSFHMSLEQMALIFQNMIANLEYQEIIQTMKDHPLIIGGKNQIDSLLMKHCPSLIAKGGAEGLMMIANIATQEVLIIKIIDGSNRVKALVSKTLCQSLNWLENDFEIDNAVYNSNRTIIGHYSPCESFGLTVLIT